MNYNIKKKIISAAVLSLVVSILCGCGQKQSEQLIEDESVSVVSEEVRKDTAMTGDIFSEKTDEKDSSFRICYISGTDLAEIFDNENGEGEAVALLKCGEKVVISELDEKKRFSAVFGEDKKLLGYVESIYLTADKNSVSKGEKAFVSIESADIFENIGGRGSVLKNIVSGDEVIILAKTSGGFWKVKTADGTVGYVSASSLSIIRSEEDSEPNSQRSSDKSKDGSESRSQSEKNTSSGESETQTYYYYEDNGGSVEYPTEENVSNSSRDESAPVSDVTSEISMPSESQSDNSDRGLDLQSAVDKAVNNSGGNWSAAVSVLSTGENSYVNDTPMQAASLIKLYIMGAVYERYDELYAKEPLIDSYLFSMITVSDNGSANHLVGLLGNGSTDSGKKAVTEYCRRNGYYNSSMGRLLLESTINGDNYTSTGDCAKFLSAVYSNSLPHSEEMLSLLKQQTRTSKIPAGVPYGIETANKTGELDYVQNDAAIVFAETPYILCVMSENVGAGSAVSSIVNLSSDVYYSINGK